MSRASKSLEVIVCTLEDALAAEAGGAHRIEIVRDLERGGLTPPLPLVRQILERVLIPARVMLREIDLASIDLVFIDACAAEIDITPSAANFEFLRRAILNFADLPLDGIVLGFTRNGDVDVETTTRLLHLVPHMRATFHRAFEAVAHQQTGIQALKSIPQIDRLLLSGQGRESQGRISYLAEMAALAAPEICLVAGGGLGDAEFRVLAEQGAVTEFHSGRVVREPRHYDGAVHPQRVAELVAVLNHRVCL